MKKLIERADRYLQVWNWKDAALLKLCVGALGVLAGLALPTRWKKPAVIFAGLVFVASYVPLMAKLLPFLQGGEDAE